MAIPKYFKLVKKLRPDEQKQFKAYLKQSKKGLALLNLLEVSAKIESYDKALISKKLSKNSIKYYNVYSNRLYGLLLNFLASNNLQNDKTLKANLWMNEIIILSNKWLLVEAQKEIIALEKYIQNERLDFLTPSLHDIKYQLIGRARINMPKYNGSHDLAVINDDLEKIRLNTISKYFLVNIFDYVNNYALLDYASKNYDIQHFIPTKLKDELKSSGIFPTNVNYHRAMAMYFITKEQTNMAIEELAQAIEIYESRKNLTISDKIKFVLVVGSIISTLLKDSTTKNYADNTKKAYYYLEKLDLHLNNYFEEFSAQNKLNITQSTANNKMYAFTMLGDIEKGRQVVNETIQFINSNKSNLKTLLLGTNYTNIAYYYFSIGDFENANHWNTKLLEIVKYNRDNSLTKYALSLDLLIRFEFEEFNLLESLKNSYKRFIKIEYPNISKRSKYFIDFFSKAIKVRYNKMAFNKLLNQTIRLLDDPKEKIDGSFHFILFKEWLLAKKSNTNIAEILHQEKQQLISD